MGHTLMGSDSNNNQRTLQRQSKHPPGRRKMVGFDVQRLASASNRDGGGAGVVNSFLRPSKATPLFTSSTTRQLHNGVTPTMFSDLVDIIHKKQGVLVLNKGSPTPATDRTFTLSMPTTTSRFPFDRKIHLQNQGSSIHFTQ